MSLKENISLGLEIFKILFNLFFGLFGSIQVYINPIFKHAIINEYAVGDLS